MKQLFGLGLLLWSFGAWAESDVLNLKMGVALEGYDPVSYFKSDKPTKGNSTIQAKEGEATYWFSSTANKDEFLKDPKKYEPQFGGWCAYAVADSKSKVPVNPENFYIQDGRLLLFYKNWLLGNTRTKWLNSDGKGEKEFLKQADANWPETKGTKP